MSFNQLRKEAGYQNIHLYNISCYRVHAGIAGSLRFDNTEEGLLIGSCEEGKEIPMHFSLKNFYASTYLFFKIQNVDCNEVLMDIKRLLESDNLNIYTS